MMKVATLSTLWDYINRAMPWTQPKSLSTEEVYAVTAYCMACHAIDKKLLGPSFADIVKKHAGKADYLAGKIKSGSSGVWGPIPMPAQSLGEADAKAIAAWLAAGAAK